MSPAESLKVCAAGQGRADAYQQFSSTGFGNRDVYEVYGPGANETSLEHETLKVHPAAPYLADNGGEDENGDIYESKTGKQPAHDNDRYWRVDAEPPTDREFPGLITQKSHGEIQHET